jgi:hypothetical protein
MFEIWPSLLPVPPLTIRKKSDVPRSVNAGNVIVLKPEPKFTLLPSCAKPPGPGPSGLSHSHALEDESNSTEVMKASRRLAS